MRYIVRTFEQASLLIDRGCSETYPQHTPPHNPPRTWIAAALKRGMMVCRGWGKFKTIVTQTGEDDHDDTTSKIVNDLMYFYHLHDCLEQCG